MTHTAPFAELIWSKSHEVHIETYYPNELFARAYRGNACLGELLKYRATDIELLVCGHSHLRVQPEIRGYVPITKKSVRQGCFPFR